MTFVLGTEEFSILGLCRGTAAYVQSRSVPRRASIGLCPPNPGETRKRSLKRGEAARRREALEPRR